MKKTLVAALTVATIAGSLVTATPSAQAHDGVGVGLAAGLIGGAIVGGALAHQNRTLPSHADPAYRHRSPRGTATRTYRGPGRCRRRAAR